MYKSAISDTSDNSPKTRKDKLSQQLYNNYYQIRFNPFNCFSPEHNINTNINLPDQSKQVFFSQNFKYVGVL